MTRKLRALWALHVTGGLNGPLLTSLLDHPSEHVRWWAIQLLCEGQTAPPIQVEPPVLRKFEQLARADRSPLVRLALASALQRLRLEDRWPIVTALLGMLKMRGTRICRLCCGMPLSRWCWRIARGLCSFWANAGFLWSGSLSRGAWRRIRVSKLDA